MNTEEKLKARQATVKKYKEKKGDEDFNALNREYQRRFRAKKKALNKNVIKPPKPTLYKVPEDIDKKIKDIDFIYTPVFIKKNIKKGLDDKNVSSSLIIIKNIHAKYTNKSIDETIMIRILKGDANKDDEAYMETNMSYINFDKVSCFVEFLKQFYENSQTISTYLAPFAIITSYFDKYSKSYQYLTKVRRVLDAVYNDTRDKNIITDPTKIISYKPEDITKKLEEIDIIKDRLIVALYMLIPPRRGEMASVILTDIEDITKLNDKNYLITAKTGYKFVFNDYKTSKTYGKQVVEVPKQLKKIIDNYTRTYYIKLKDYLFPIINDIKNHITLANFTALISTVFTNVYKTPITLNDIRMSASTYNDAQNNSLKDDKLFAMAMGHSYTTDKQYVRKK